MAATGRQLPDPLRVVKSSVDISNRPPDKLPETLPENTPLDEAADAYRRASVVTDESKGSIRGTLGASQRRLAIPKKRQPLPTWHDDGTGRFYSPSATYSATMIRRSQNVTDNTGPGGESTDVCFPSHDGHRSRSPGEVDGAIDPAEPYDSLHAYSSHEEYPIPGRPPQQPQHDQRQQCHDDDPFYTRNTSLNPMHAGQYADPATRQQHWAFDPPRGPHMPSASSYGRPISMPIMFPEEPFTRAATAAPFESPHRHHARMQQGQPGPPRRQVHYTDQVDQRLSSRFSQLGIEPKMHSASPDPRILVPVISVTPECRAVEGDVNSFWVAIELSAQITQPLETRPSPNHGFRPDCRQASACAFSADEDQELYRFGYISNLDVKILPSYQAEILEVIGKSPSLLTLLPGSRRLMVVQVHLDTTKGSARHDTQEYRPPSQKTQSDQLLEDLELQLGATSQEYMQIQLTYSHSGFPKRDVVGDPMDSEGGCLEVRTTIETTATALVMHRRYSSMWSPPAAPTSSPLVDIVAKHWGPSAAREMAQRIATSMDMRILRKDEHLMAAWGGPRSEGPPQRQLSKTPDNANHDGSLDEETPRAKSNETMQQAGRPKEELLPAEDGSPAQEHPKAPLRKTRKLSRPASSALDRLASTTLFPRKRVSLPQIPKLAQSSANIPVPMDAESMPPGCLLPRSKNMRTGVDGPRQPIPESAPLSIRRPDAPDTTKRQNYLQGSAAEPSLEGENHDRLAAFAGLRSASRSSTASKASGKWSWSGWFS